MKKQRKLVKIFPKEYWKEDVDEGMYGYTVNGEKFHSSLDTNMKNSRMKKFFGGIYLIDIIDDSDDLSIRQRPEYFIIVDQKDVDHSIYEWDLCCIEKILTKDDYPEYWL